MSRGHKRSVGRRSTSSGREPPMRGGGGARCSGQDWGGGGTRIGTKMSTIKIERVRVGFTIDREKTKKTEGGFSDR